MVIGDEEQDLLRLGEEVARFTDADLGMDMGMGMREEDEEDEHMQGMGDEDDQGSEGEEEDEDEEVDDEDAMTDDEAVFEVFFLLNTFRHLHAAKKLLLVSEMHCIPAPVMLVIA